MRMLVIAMGGMSLLATGCPSDGVGGDDTSGDIDAGGNGPDAERSSGASGTATGCTTRTVSASRAATSS